MSELVSFFRRPSCSAIGGASKFAPVPPDDQADLVAAIRQASPQSLYRRFFAPRRSFTPEGIVFFVHVDVVDDIALAWLPGVAGAADQRRAWPKA